MSDVFNRLKRILVDRLGVDESEVTMEASFTDDLGADSLDLIELLMEVEDEFGIEIPDEDAIKITTVGQAVEYINSHLQKEKNNNMTVTSYGVAKIVSEPTKKLVIKPRENLNKSNGSFLKNLAKGLSLGFFGGLGYAIGGATAIAGEIVGSQFLREVGKAVRDVGVKSGELVGDAIAGAYDMAAGLVTGNDQQRRTGAENLKNTASQTVNGVVQGLGYAVCSALDTVNGLLTGNSEQAKEGAKGLAKVALVSALGVGVVDVLGGPDKKSANAVPDVDDPLRTANATLDGDGDLTQKSLHQQVVYPSVDEELKPVSVADKHSAASEPTETGASEEVILVENPNTHFVHPHERHLPDGRVIWVDGDGDTTVNRSVEEGGGWVQHNPDYRIPKD